LPWSRERENVGFHVATKTWVLDLFFWTLLAYFCAILCRNKVKLHSDCLYAQNNVLEVFLNAFFLNCKIIFRMSNYTQTSLQQQRSCFLSNVVPLSIVSFFVLRFSQRITGRLL